MTEKEIKEKLMSGERISLECKKAKSEVPKSVWEIYSAFANTVGGVILLGVEENRQAKEFSGRFSVSGVDNPGKIMTDFWNTLNSNKVNCNILRDEDVGTVEVDGRQVVFINVPQADWRMKPVYLNENVYKGSFRRNNEGDYHCTEEEVRAMVRDANENGNDCTLIEYYGMDDIDSESLRQYRTQFRILNSDHVWNNDDDKEFLIKLGGYTVDRRTGKEGLTLAGLLMFGKGLPIRERFANFRMDYLDMSDLVGDERYRDRLTYDGRWENNLYQFYSRVMPKLVENLPRPFKMEGIRRIDDTPLHKAVREAMTNAIIHSDFFLSGGILRVEKYSDYICLRNPGTLKLPIEQIYKGGNSKARNPRMQTMFRMIGYGENVGSGFPMIVDAWKQSGWRKPLLENRLDLNEVCLTLFLFNDEPNGEPKLGSNEPNGEPKLGSNEPNGEPKLALCEPDMEYKRSGSVSDDNLEAVLHLIARNPMITQEQIAEEIGKSKATVKRYMRKLKADEKIRRIGPVSFGGYWEVVEPE